MVTLSTNIASKIKDKKGDITDDEVSLNFTSDVVTFFQSSNVMF